MPELPEVETVKRGLLPFCKNQFIKDIIVRESRLRWSVTSDISARIKNQRICNIHRRGKYLLFELSVGTLMVHLGMSGVLRACHADEPVKKHDHVDIVLDSNIVLRYNDPRRFGAVLFTAEPIETHPLVNHLGPEPLGESFTDQYIFEKTRRKKTPIKSWLMNADNVVGVGNIYACEVLFLCNIHPLMQAEKVTRDDSRLLYQLIKKVLEKAIESGGTTLKDFKNAQGKPGYFSQQLNVYGREGKSCVWCGHKLSSIKISGRQTVYCENCQPNR